VAEAAASLLPPHSAFICSQQEFLSLTPTRYKSLSYWLSLQVGAEPYVKTHTLTLPFTRNLISVYCIPEETFRPLLTEKFPFDSRSVTMRGICIRSCGRRLVNKFQVIFLSVIPRKVSYSRTYKIASNHILVIIRKIL
jgi:hypothetical protein